MRTTDKNRLRPRIGGLHRTGDRSPALRVSVTSAFATPDTFAVVPREVISNGPGLSRDASELWLGLPDGGRLRIDDIGPLARCAGRFGGGDVSLLVPRARTPTRGVLWRSCPAWRTPRVPPVDGSTGELDTAGGEDAFTVLRCADDKLGGTVLVVTHVPLMACRVRRTVRMREGRTSAETLRERGERVRSSRFWTGRAGSGCRGTTWRGTGRAAGFGSRVRRVTWAYGRIVTTAATAELRLFPHLLTEGWYVPRVCGQHPCS